MFQKQKNCEKIISNQETLRMTTQNIQFGQPTIYITQNPVISDPIIEASQKHGFLFYKLGVSLVFLNSIIHDSLPETY